MIFKSLCKCISKFNNYSRLYSAVLVVFFIFIVINAQGQLSNKSMNFSAHNEKLSNVLYRLAIASEINLSYNSSDEFFNKKVSCTFVDKPPLIIIDELLHETKYLYKKVGSQVVIYKDVNSNKKVKPVPLAKVDNKISVITDTVIVIKSDTIIVMDTVVVTDTVFIEKINKATAAIHQNEIPTELFNPLSARQNGWSGSFFVAPIISNFSMVTPSNSLSFRNFAFGVEANKDVNNWSFSAGAKLTLFSKKVLQSYTINNGGYFVTDTVDSYYTVIEHDTAWYYVTDSLWKPVDDQKYSYDINNRIGYVDVFATLSYHYYNSSNYRLYIKGGLQSGFLIYKSGISVSDNNQEEDINFDDLKFKTPSFSFILATGVKYKISNAFDFNPEVYYFQNFNDAIIDYPQSDKIIGLGFKFGLIYYF